MAHCPTHPDVALSTEEVCVLCLALDDWQSDDDEGGELQADFTLWLEGECSDPYARDAALIVIRHSPAKVFRQYWYVNGPVEAREKLAVRVCGKCIAFL